MDVTGDAVPADPAAARAAQERRPPPRRTAALWFGVMGGPLAAFVNQQLSYALVTWACQRPEAAFPRLTARILPALLLALALLSAAVAWRSRRSDPPSADAPQSAGRPDFMALLGVGLGVVFSLVIIAEWLAAAVLRTCPQSS